VGTQATTRQEREAVRTSGKVDPDAFKAEPADQQESDTLGIVELAAIYIAHGGTDRRAQKVFKAGQKAGHIDSTGNYVGPQARENSEPSDLDNALAGSTPLNVAELMDLCGESEDDD